MLVMLAMAEVRRAISLVVKWATAPAKMGRMRMGMGRMPETSPTQRLESVRAYMTQDWAAVRATAPMSKRGWEVRRRAKPGIARTRRTCVWREVAVGGPVLKI